MRKNEYLLNAARSTSRRTVLCLASAVVATSFPIFSRPAVAQVRGCSPTSFSPEVTSYYGDAPTILEKVGKANPDLHSRRVFGVCIQSSGKAEFLFFERVAGTDRYDLHRWKGTSSASLTAKIDATILDVRGRLCIGEQVKGVVIQTCGDFLVDEGTVPAPATATAVLRHALKPYGNAYISVSLILLC